MSGFRYTYQNPRFNSQAETRSRNVHWTFLLIPISLTASIASIVHVKSSNQLKRWNSKCASYVEEITTINLNRNARLKKHKKDRERKRGRREGEWEEEGNRRAEVLCWQWVSTIDNEFKFDSFLIEYCCDMRLHAHNHFAPTDRQTSEKCKVNHFPFMTVASSQRCGFYGNYKIMHFLCPLSHSIVRFMAIFSLLLLLPVRHSHDNCLSKPTSSSSPWIFLCPFELTKSDSQHFLAFSFRFAWFYWISNEL